MGLLDTLTTMGVDSVSGLGEHLTDTEKLGQIGLSPENYNVISAMNAADNMNAGVGSLFAPGALYTLGDTLTNPNQGFMEGISDFGRYMKGANIQNNPELAKQLMGENYVNQMQGKYGLAMDKIGKGIFGKGPNPDLYNRQSPMGTNVIGMDETNTYGNTIAEAMIDEDRIPGRVQESVPNYQNWFERMMSGAQDKLGGAWGKTKDLGSRFKEGARPVWGLASMIGNATNPLNPKAFNYNPGLKGQLDFMDKEMGGWSTNNPGTGLMQYAQGTPLAGQNVFSGFGSNDPITQLEKQMARHQKTIDKIPGNWSKLAGKNIDPETGLDDLARKIAIHQGRFDDTQAWHTKLSDERKAKQAAATKVAQASHDAQMAKSGITVSSGGYQGGDGGRNRGGQGAFKEDTTSMRSAGRTYTDARGNKGYSRGRRDGGRVGYGNGGLATLFTRRG